VLVSLSLRSLTADRSCANVGWNIAGEGPFTQAIFATEMHGAGTWNFGPVTYLNTFIAAQTTDASWCNK
jgi:hypothetical protein